jgi:transposase
MIQDSIGIDVSKDHLDVHCLGDGRAERFGNNAAGFRKLKAWLPKADTIARVVYEATGPYHAAFERYFGSELPLVKVNPLQARRFAQSKGARAKTDAVDARMLAQMGAALELVPQQPISETMRELKELQVARQALVKDRTRLLNRIKTQTATLVVKQGKARLALIERHLHDIDAEIRTRINAGKPQARAVEIITSIPGLGAVSAAAILVECPEIGTLNRKQVASLAGLAPMTRQSGQWKGKAFIQGGRKHLRDALYMPAIVAMRYNPHLKAIYERHRAAGKPAKVAIIALMRKLIELANALVKADRIWLPKSA